jgi:hypothetical protein
MTTTVRKKKRKKRYHTGVHESPKAGSCKYRSGWELKYMMHLDTNVDVISYGYESIKIPYVSNTRTKKIRTYYPDFVVERSTGKTVVEIKPKKRLTQARVIKKLKAAETWCRDHGMTLEIITETELKLLGLL